MRERIGVIGLGRMGSALAARSSSQGYETCGWSRSGGCAETAAAGNYTLSEALKEAVALSDILMLSLLDGGAVEDILGQLAKLDLTSKLIVETSTISPDITRRNHAAITGAGGTLVDAPISGGPEMVADGTMGLFIGGDDDAVERFMRIAPAFSNRIAHVGGLGAGAAAKIVNNIAIAGAFGSAIEAVSVGSKMGLDLRTMMGFLENSPGITPMLKARIPMILGDDDRVGFSMNSGAPAGEMFLDEASKLGVATPALEAQIERAREAQAAGLGEKDYAAIFKFVLEK